MVQRKSKQNFWYSAQEAHKTNIKFQHVALENPRKRGVQNKFNHKIKRTHHMGALSRA